MKKKDKETEFARESYLRANAFLRELRHYGGVLDRDQLLTLRGQALAGDVYGARRGLARLTRDKFGGTADEDHQGGRPEPREDGAAL